jgi:hypothetical protein
MDRKTLSLADVDGNPVKMRSIAPDKKATVCTDKKLCAAMCKVLDENKSVQAGHVATLLGSTGELSISYITTKKNGDRALRFRVCPFCGTSLLGFPVSVKT